MSIEPIIPLVERVVAAQEEEGFFSYRHAEELHALGIKREFSPSSPWSQVCVSIVVTSLMPPKIWVRVLWSRAKLEYPREECPPWEFPLSEIGVYRFEKEWPVIRQQLARAVARGHPEEKMPNQ